MGRRSSIILLLIFFLLSSCKKEVKEEPFLQKEEVKEEKKLKTYVVFSLENKKGILFPETITIEEKENELENLKTLLENYFSRRINLLFPEGINLRALYPLNKNLVLDLYIPDNSAPLQSIREEMIFVNSLAKTVCLNFQRYKSVNILINGSEENKFINHIALYVSYKP